MKEGAQGPLLPGRRRRGDEARARKGLRAACPTRALADERPPDDGRPRSGMGYVGCRTIEELRHNATFVRITSSGLRESHVHDVIITRRSAQLPGRLGSMDIHAEKILILDFGSQYTQLIARRVREPGRYWRNSWAPDGRGRHSSLRAPRHHSVRRPHVGGRRGRAQAGRGGV